jgi:hypothetical protein
MRRISVLAIIGEFQNQGILDGVLMGFAEIFMALRDLSRFLLGTTHILLCRTS